MSDSGKALLLIAIVVSLVLMVQPDALASMMKRQPVPRRVLSKAEMQLFTTTSVTGEIVMVGAQGVLIDQGSQAVRVGTTGLSLLTGAAERMSIDSTGKVVLKPASTTIHTGAVSTRPAFGTSVSASEIRSLTAPGADTGFLRLSAGGANTGSTAGSYIDIAGSGSGEMDKNIVFATAGVERIRVLNDGRVGINTNSPTDSTIHMVGTQGLLLDQGSQAVRVGTSAISLLTGGAERVRVNANGGVGIGTDNPIASLDVTGSAIVVGTSSNASGVKQALISESNNHSGARWWLLSSGSCASSAIGYFININGSFARVNEGDVGIDLVFSVNYGYLNVAKSIIYGKAVSDQSTANTIQLWKNTSTDKIDVYIYSDSYAYANFKLIYAGASTINLSNTYSTTTAPVTSASYTKIWDTSINSTTTFAAGGNVGIGTNNPGYALDVVKSSGGDAPYIRAATNFYSGYGSYQPVVSQRLQWYNEVWDMAIYRSDGTGSNGWGVAYGGGVDAMPVLAVNSTPHVLIRNNLSQNSSLLYIASAYGGNGLGLNIFQNSSDRTVEGGGLCATIRNDAGALRLQGADGYNNNNGITITSSGSVGIGTGSPMAQLHVHINSGVPLVLRNTWVDYTWRVGPNNDGHFQIIPEGGQAGVKTYPGWGSWASSSDIRLKQDITPLDNCLSKIVQLNPVSYRFKENPSREKKLLGLIAQEVLEIVPEVVQDKNAKGEEMMMTVFYSDLIPVLIGAIKDQQQIISSLTDRLARVEAFLSR